MEAGSLSAAAPGGTLSKTNPNTIWTLFLRAAQGPALHWGCPLSPVSFSSIEAFPSAHTHILLPPISKEKEKISPLELVML